MYGKDGAFVTCSAETLISFVQSEFYKGELFNLSLLPLGTRIMAVIVKGIDPDLTASLTVLVGILKLGTSQERRFEETI